jgi:methyltransferase
MDLSLQHLFLGIVAFTIFQRIYELFLAKRNEKHLLSLGGKIIKEKNYLFMVLLHTSWLVCLLYFATMVKLDISSLPFYLGLSLFVLGQALRVIAIRTLGKRWSTKIVILPESDAVKKGIFKIFRHPNYVGVVLEIFALPLMAGLIKVAIIFSLLNFVILYFRIKLEEKMLGQYNNYFEIFSLEKNNA